MASTNDFSSYQAADYLQYSLENKEIRDLAQKHSTLKDDVLKTNAKSNTSHGYIGGGYILSIVGSIVLIIIFLIHIFLGQFEPLTNLKGLRHFSKIFSTNTNGMKARNGVSALFKLLIYVSLIVTFTTVGSHLMIIPHNKKYRQYNREKSKLIEERNKAQKALDDKQKELDSLSI